MQLPTVVDDHALDALMADAGQVARCLEHVSTSLGLDSLAPPVRGSTLVGMNETSAVKLTPPFAHGLATSERVSLLALDGALPVATPRILDDGVLDGWSYVHMTRLPGIELKERWPTLEAKERLSVATQLGECLQTLHRLSPPASLPRCDWHAWTRDRVPTIKERHQGAPAEWVELLPQVLASSDLSTGTQGWLHTEIMLEHLLVTDDDHVTLSGLFDFEPSWVGPTDYEYASVALFVSGGDRSILAEVLRAAGESIGPERLFAMAVLHRYGRLGWYQRRLGGPDDLESWIDAVFGTDPAAHSSE